MVMLVLLIVALCCLCFAPSIGFLLRDGELPVQPGSEAGDPAPPFAEIEAAAADMTDAQWGDYASDLTNTLIVDWEGVVFDVDVGEVLGGHTVYFDAGSQSFVPEVHVVVDEDTALALEKGAAYRLDGRLINAVNLAGLLAIRVDQATLTPLDD